MRARLMCLVSALGLATPCVGDQPPGTPTTPAPPLAKPPKAATKHPLSATVISERGGFVPGEVSWIGLAMDMEPGWHTYWPGDNDTGSATRIEVSAPEGWTVGSPVWPAPIRYVGDGDLIDYVYEGQALVLIPVTVAKDAKVGESASIMFDTEWLVCKTACIPGSARMDLTMAVQAESQPSKAAGVADRFAKARARVPKPASEAGPSLKTAWSGSTLTISFTGAKRLAFYPAADSLKMADAIKQGVREGDRLELGFARPAEGQGDEAPRTRVLGVLEVTNATGAASFYKLDLAAPVNR